MALIHKIDLVAMVHASNRADRPIAPNSRKQVTAFNSENGELNITAPGDSECMKTAEKYSFRLSRAE